MKRLPLTFGRLRGKLVLLVIACFLTVSHAHADTVVVPNYSTNSQVANAGEGIFTTTTRHQIVYGASEFPPYPIVINEIQWRPDIYTGGPVTNATIANIQINLSTTASSADHLSSTFSQNIGTNETVVFSGPLTLNTSFITLPNGTTAFDINVPLQTPFVYDPSKGNLLVDVRDFTGASANIYDNSTSSGSDTVSRVFSTSDPNATIANASDSGGGVIQITYTPLALPPSIISQPTNQTILVNGSATFAVSANGTQPLTYQWFFNDTNSPVNDATNSSLTLLNVQTNQAGIYFVGVSNSFGSSLSSNAQLTVRALPFINAQPADQVLIPGASATFTVSVSSGVPVTYQWFFNNTNLIAGATNASITLTNLGANQSGVYSVQISNMYGSTISSNAHLIVQLVVPNYSTNSQVANAGEGIFATTTRHQIVYGASEFPPYPIVINEIRWRPDSYTGGPVTNATIANIQINLSTTVNGADQLSSTFSQNIGTDETVVFSGPLTLNTSFITLPNGTTAFDINVPLQTPFVYDPSKGNLLVDVRDFTGASANIYDNSTSSGSDTVSRVFSTSDPNATIANASDSGGGVIQIIYSSPAIPPIITSQPTNRSATLGGSTTFKVIAAAAFPISYQWFLTDTNNPIIGQTNASLILSNLQPSQAGIYLVRAVDDYGATVSSNAVLTVTIDPPSIAAQPVNRSGVVGTNFTFTVGATGSLPLTYQWYYNTNILLSGATNSSLVLSNIQFNQSGTYSVVVSNAYGVTNSAKAVLTVSYPPVKVLMGSTNVMGGGAFTLPIYLIANGNENTLNFSMNFNAQRLTYASLDLGNGAADAALFPNTSQSANGRLGITMQLPVGETFVPGTQEVARVTFLSSFVTNTPVVTPVNFTNQPIARAVFDVNGIKLATNFINGSVTLGVSDFEGDVTPRTTGDHSLDIFDWTQVGRFVAGLDIVSNAAEFQRADCAPTNTSGDGQLKVTDWVQAGRYGAAIDPPMVAGGPTAPVAPVTLTGGPRTVNIAGGTGVKGLNVTVPVILQSQGNENAFGFSVNFDPAMLKYVSATKGSATGSATLLVNSNQASSGRVGVLLALQSGNTFTNGTQPEIAKLTFTALSLMTNGAVTFTNGPVLLAISDPTANELPANYTNSLVTINPPPTLKPALTDTNVTFSWPTWGTGFNLQATGDLTQPWTNVNTTAQTNGTDIIITLPVPAQGGYFRLQHP